MKFSIGFCHVTLSRKALSLSSLTCLLPANAIKSIRSRRKSSSSFIGLPIIPGRRALWPSHARSLVLASPNHVIFSPTARPNDERNLPAIRPASPSNRETIDKGRHGIRHSEYVRVRVWGERAREKWKAIELHIRREVGQLLLLPSFLASCFPSIGDYIRQDMRRGGARCRGGGDDHMRPWRSRELVRA